jgi:hypothetical protein
MAVLECYDGDCEELDYDEENYSVGSFVFLGPNDMEVACTGYKNYTVVCDYYDHEVEGSWYQLEESESIIVDVSH